MAPRTLTDETLITLSADPRSLDPGTIRQVLRENGLHLPAAVADATFFTECVTVRRLLAAGEVDRAELCATQLGHALADFAPTAPAMTLVVTHADGVALDLPATAQRYAAQPDRAQLLRELRWHLALRCPHLGYAARVEQIRLAANAVLLPGTGGPPRVRPVTAKEVAGIRVHA